MLAVSMLRSCTPCVGAHLRVAAAGARAVLHPLRAPARAASSTKFVDTLKAHRTSKPAASPAAPAPSPPPPAEPALSRSPPPPSAKKAAPPPHAAPTPVEQEPVFAKLTQPGEIPKATAAMSPSGLDSEYVERKAQLRAEQIRQHQAAQAAKTAAAAGEPPKKSALETVKSAIKEYGATAGIVYGALWIVPCASAWSVFYAFDNFGHNPASILQFLGIKDWVFDTLGWAHDARPERWQISTLYAYLFTDLLEFVRIPATLALAPRVKRWWDARKLAVGAVAAAATEPAAAVGGGLDPSLAASAAASASQPVSPSRPAGAGKAAVVAATASGAAATGGGSRGKPAPAPRLK